MTVDELTQEVRTRLNPAYEIVDLFEDAVIVKSADRLYAIDFDIVENGRVVLDAAPQPIRRATVTNLRDEAEEVYVPDAAPPAPAPDLEQLKAMILENARTIEWERALQKDLREQIDATLNASNEGTHAAKLTVQKITFSKGAWGDTVSCAKWLRKNGFSAERIQETGMDFEAEQRPESDFVPESLYSLNEHLPGDLDPRPPGQRTTDGPYPSGVSFTIGRLRLGIKEISAAIFIDQVRQAYP